MAHLSTWPQRCVLVGLRWARPATLGHGHPRGLCFGTRSTIFPGKPRSKAADARNSCSLRPCGPHYPRTTSKPCADFHDAQRHGGLGHGANFAHGDWGQDRGRAATTHHREDCGGRGRETPRTKRRRPPLETGGRRSGERQPPTPTQFGVHGRSHTQGYMNQQMPFTSTFEVSPPGLSMCSSIYSKCITKCCGMSNLLQQQ